MIMYQVGIKINFEFTFYFVENLELCWDLEKEIKGESNKIW